MGLHATRKAAGTGQREILGISQGVQAPALTTWTVTAFNGRRQLRPNQLIRQRTRDPTPNSCDGISGLVDSYCDTSGTLGIHFSVLQHSAGGGDTKRNTNSQLHHLNCSDQCGRNGIRRSAGRSNGRVPSSGSHHLRCLTLRAETA